VADHTSLTADDLGPRVQRLLISPGERLTNRDRDLVGEALRRARERDEMGEALVDRGLEVDRLLARNQALEAVFEAALARRQASGGPAGREADRRLGAALSRASRVPGPPRPWLPPEAVTLVRAALAGVVDGLERRPPVVGTLAAGRAKDALKVVRRYG
jgi:hypothetical protein